MNGNYLCVLLEVFDFPPFPSFFHDSAQQKAILTSFSYILWKIWLQVTPAQVTRPGQVTQSPKKVCNRVTATLVERKIWKSQDLVHHLVPISCISRNSYMIDLRSGSQVSQWEKLKIHYTVYTHQICSTRSEPCSFRLMVMTPGPFLHMWPLERLFKVIQWRHKVNICFYL